ncbi:MAG: pitrilysin family protein [Lentisphaerota bacterium]
MSDFSSRQLLKKDYFADVRSFAFDNGLHVYVNEKHDIPAVTIQAWIKTGSIHEDDYLGCGLSHFLEHMLFQGCSGYPAQSAADLINNLGGEVNAYTSYGNTVYYLDLPSRHCLKGLDVLTAMVSSPEFPADKFKLESRVILRERDMVFDRPDRVLGEKLWKDVFLVHPVRHPVIGYRDRIKAVTREMMADYYELRYSPERCFFMISGDVDAGRIAQVLEKKLSKWRRGNIAEPFLPEEPEQNCFRRCDYVFKDPLARIAAGYKLPDASSAEIPALDILCGLMGQSRSSRLIQRLKTEKELAIGISSFNYTPSFCGMMGISAVCTPDKVSALEAELRTELDLIAGGDISEEEVQREQIQQATEYIRCLQTNGGMASVIGNTVLTFGYPEAANRYFDILSGVTLDQVKEVARRCLPVDRQTLVRLLPDDNIDAGTKKIKAGSAIKPEMKIISPGLRLVEYADSSLPLIDVCAVLPGGTFMETRSNAGISKLLSTMLNTSTARWTEDELSRKLDENAIDFSVSAGANSLLFRLNCRSDRFEQAMEILQSVMSEPHFGGRELAREKSNIAEALKSRMMSPRNAAEDRALELLFGKHPYGLPRSGSVAGINSITAAQLKAFYRRCLTPERVVFGIAGDYDRSAAGKAFKRLAAAISWKQDGVEAEVEPPVFPDHELMDKIELPREQTAVIYALPGCDNISEDRFAFDILQFALNGLSSNLFKKVREEAALAYSTGVSFSRGIHRGVIAFHAGTEMASAARAAEMLRAERFRLAEKGITEDEFKAAKESAIFDCAQNMEKMEYLLMNSALAEYYGNGFELPWRQVKIYNSLRRSEVNRIAAKYLSGASAVTVIAGK